MVLVKFINSLGLGKKEVKQSGTSSPSESDVSEEEHSICNDVAAVPKGTCVERDNSIGSASTLATEHDAESVTSSESSDDCYTYSKMLMLRARATVGPSTGLYSTRPVTEFEESWSAQMSWSPSANFKKKSDTPKARLEPLTPTASSWVAQQRKSASSNTPDNDGAVTRAACSILNKLTVEKFDSLFEQLATCGISKPEHLQMLMREVFHKATMQHHFVPMYADLCVRLEQDPRIAAVVEAAGHQHSFRRLLLNQCQISFEQLLEPCDEATEKDEEERLRRKQQAMGNMKLIGRLLVHGLVTSKVLVECAEEILRCHKTCPDALESLAALLMVAGKQFDNANWQFHPRLLEVFSTMKALSKDKSTPARVRFLLRDVLDHRQAGWSHCTYTAATAAAPMRLDEVRETATHEVKYMNLEEQMETDTLLAGLQRIAQMAAKNKSKDIVSTEKRTESDSKPSRKKGRQKGSRAAPTVSETAGRPKAGDQEDFREPFDIVSFRRTLATILADLSSDRNIPAAVRRIRLQGCPIEYQAKEFADIITRVVEEKRGPIRRSCLAFAAGLGAAEQSAFDREACLDGVGQFFEDVYPELCTEIPRLPAIVTSELLPTLRNVFPKSDINKILPAGFGF